MRSSSKPKPVRATSISRWPVRQPTHFVVPSACWKITRHIASADRVHYLARLARCHLLDAEVEQARVIAHQALDLSHAIDSARVTERIREFHEALTPYGDHTDASLFRERFAAVNVP